MNLLSKLYLSAALLMLAAAQTAYADEEVGFPTVVGSDFKYVATAPSRWDSDDWQTLGWASLAVVGTAVVADRPVRDFMCQRSKMSSCPGAGPDAEVTNSTLTTIENFGQTYALGVMGGFYLAGVVGDSEKSVQVAQDLVSASLVSATIGQTVKIAVNRYRPRDNEGVYNAQGYTGFNNNSSFPSGHTTEAFTLAAVIASSYDEKWVSYTVYSLAGLVGIARMYHDAHWASDVTTSALLGTFVGKAIVKHNSDLRHNKNKVVMLPMLSPDFTGVQLIRTF
jgi:hypothetical protein